MQSLLNVNVIVNRLDRISHEFLIKEVPSSGLSKANPQLWVPYFRDLRSFDIRFEGRPIRFDSKGIGRFENFRIESAVAAPLLVVSFDKRLVVQ